MRSDVRTAIRGLVVIAVAAFAVGAVAASGPDGPWLGLVAGPADGAGARVLAVVPGGPADRAGVRPGDVVESLGGVPIASDRDLGRGLGSASPGDALPYRLARDGATVEGRIVVGARSDRGDPAPSSDRPAPSVPEAAGGAVDVGLYTLAIPSELRLHLGAPADAGVLLSVVEAGSPAARAGLQVGDVVTRAGADLLRSPGDLYRAVLTAPEGQTVPLVVVRAGETVVLSLDPSGRGEAGTSDAEALRGERAGELRRRIEAARERLERLERELESLERPDAPAS